LISNGSINTRFILVDLDGTIVDEKINNTFDFLKSYLKYKYNIMGIARYRLATLFTLLASKIIENNDVFLRNLFIKLCIVGLDIRDLIKFTVKYWLPHISHTVNIDVLNFVRKMKKEGYIPIMLTSCIEVPARLISNYLEFEGCIATKLRLFGPLIVGISEDTYGPLKFESARRLLGCKQVQQAIYVADSASLAIEKASLYVNKIYCVNKNA